MGVREPQIGPVAADPLGLSVMSKPEAALPDVQDRLLLALGPYHSARWEKPFSEAA